MRFIQLVTPCHQLGEVSVDGADMFKKRDFLITSQATCSKNGDFLSHRS